MKYSETEILKHTDAILDFIQKHGLWNNWIEEPARNPTFVHGVDQMF